MLRLLALAAPVLALALAPGAATAAGELSISPSSISVVEYTPVTFSAQPLSASDTLTWSFGDGARATGTSVTHAFVGARQYTVTVTEKDAGGVATGTGTVAVDVTPYVVTVTPGPADTQWTPAPTPGTPLGGPPPGFKLPLINAGAKPRRVAANRAAITASCMFATGACHGSVVLRSAKPVRDRPGRKARVVELGRKAFTVQPKAVATIAIPLSRRALALVKKLGSLPATATVSARDDAGNTGDDTVAVTLLRRR